MRTAWAVVLILAVIVSAWWLARDPEAPATTRPAVEVGEQAQAKRVLYRWRDANGVVQVTDTPPKGHRYETLDVDALDRRNRFDPQQASPATE